MPEAAPEGNLFFASWDSYSENCEGLLQKEHIGEKHIYTPVFIKVKKKLKDQENATCFPFLRKSTLNNLK